VGSGVWEIPGRTSHAWVNAIIAGWRLGNVFTFHRGLPFSVLLGGDNENIGSVGGRFPEYANSVGDHSAISNPGPAEWFNKGLRHPPLYTVGNAGRNILRTDTLINDDCLPREELEFWRVSLIRITWRVFQCLQSRKLWVPGSHRGNIAIWPDLEDIVNNRVPR
jgi:hypothetical protein